MRSFREILNEVRSIHTTRIGDKRVDTKYDRGKGTYTTYVWDDDGKQIGGSVTTPSRKACLLVHARSVAALEKKLGEGKYSRPYGLSMLPSHLKSCPIHKWRAKSGIELVHKEPDNDEQERIWKNWLTMTSKQKRRSEEQSQRLFGKTNREHHEEITKARGANKS